MKAEATSASTSQPRTANALGIRDREVFLAQVRAELETMVDSEMEGTGWTGKNCPWIAHYIGWFRGRSEQDWQRFLLRWVGPGADRLTESELRLAVVDRARQGVKRWRTTGQSPDALPMGPAGTPLAPVALSGLQAMTFGAGEALSSALKSSMSSVFGGSLDEVTVHRDATAQGAARERGVRGFALGPHVVLGEGWQPGTLSGDLLLAHEVAHTQQQRRGGGQGGQSAERNADQAAVAAVAAARGQHVERPAVRGTGLSLQRCFDPDEEYDDDDEGSTLRAGKRLYDAPHLDPAKRPARPKVQPPVEEEGLLDDRDATWVPQTDDMVLAIRSGDRLFLLPSKPFVTERSRPMAKSKRPPNPTRRSGTGLTAVGAGSLRLVAVGDGVGLLIDAGGAGGTTRTILPGAVAALRASMGITRIDAVLLIHTHADHVRHLVRLIESGNIQGNRVFVWPGFEAATSGPWAKVLTKLRDPSMAGRGFGPSWSPTTVPTTTIGSGSNALTVGRLQVGNTRLEMVTRTADLRAYVNQLRAGSTGTKTADAASMLTRVRPATGPDQLIVGDLRGRTIGQIISGMNAAGTNFSTWVSRVRLVAGFHHLGNVQTGADTAGYRSLLQALPTGQTITIVAQAKGSKVNTVFRQRLNAAGFRVVVVPEADASMNRQFTYSQGGKVKGHGVSIHEAVGKAPQANARVQKLRAAAQVLRNPEIVEPLLATGDRAGARRLANKLAAEAATLEAAVRAKRNLELTGVHNNSRPSDYGTRAAAIDTRLTAVGAEEARMGGQALAELARMQPRVGELVKLMREVAKTGKSRPRLRQLLAEVGPSVYKRILSRIPERTPSNASLRARAIRGSLAQLLRQRDLQRALQTGARPVGGAGRGVVALLVFVEVVNTVGPIIAQSRANARANKQQKLMSVVGALGWWGRLGLRVPFTGGAGGKTLAPEAVGASLVRRLWEATPHADRIKKSELQPVVANASPLDTLVLPDPSTWPATFWALFVERLQSIMPTRNEWSTWIDDDPGVGIRDRGDGTWEVLTGSIDWSGTSTVAWRASAPLTKAMKAREASVRTQTNAWLASALRLSPPSSPKPGQATVGRPSSDVGTQTATFKAGASRVAQGPYDGQRVKGVTWNRTPRFVVFPSADAPSGFIWATGADEPTYHVVRRMKVFRYEQGAVVQIPKPTLHDRTYKTGGLMPSAFDWTKKNGTPEQKAAMNLVKAHGSSVEWVPYPNNHRDINTYYGEVRFPSDQPNTAGMVLLKRAELALVKRTP